ncbi:unnamed protein product, partial [Vitis vinifera]
MSHLSIMSAVQCHSVYLFSIELQNLSISVKI